jgi:tRNA A37 N6-isopentenylltransferase MiaA
MLRLFARNDVVIMAGGSGMYIDAVCRALMIFLPWRRRGTGSMKNSLLRDWKDCGKLQQCDPEYYARVDLRTLNASAKHWKF